MRLRFPLTIPTNKIVHWNLTGSRIPIATWNWKLGVRSILLTIDDGESQGPVSCTRSAPLLVADQGYFIGYVVAADFRVMDADLPVRG
jgi:hypothetical protein